MDYALIEMWRRRRRARNDRRRLERRSLRDQSNPFELPAVEFVSLFRANKAMVLHITEQLKNDLEPIRVGGVPGHIKIVNVNCRILGVTAQYPGRVHDQYVFNNSNVKREMKEVYESGGNYFLIGDSGYALEQWLMTPVLHAAAGSAEEAYTRWHCRARNCVERTNGYIKNSFRCLRHDRVLHYQPEVVSQIIYTT